MNIKDPTWVNDIVGCDVNARRDEKDLIKFNHTYIPERCRKE